MKLLVLLALCMAVVPALGRALSNSAFGYEMTFFYYAYKIEYQVTGGVEMTMAPGLSDSLKRMADFGEFVQFVTTGDIVARPPPPTPEERAAEAEAKKAAAIAAAAAGKPVHVGGAGRAARRAAKGMPVSWNHATLVTFDPSVEANSGVKFSNTKVPTTADYKRINSNVKVDPGAGKLTDAGAQAWMDSFTESGKTITQSMAKASDPAALSKDLDRAKQALEVVDMKALLDSLPKIPTKAKETAVEKETREKRENLRNALSTFEVDFEKSPATITHQRVMTAVQATEASIGACSIK
ncbi:hypothetical protein EJ06DRAFT_525068 [Trichodelitschia bisporula]|uniref:Uncharacterized protein n=1 Tax=Trichodelitschia bisporula TaxID=703511 RepID=A0A6G1HJQ0_9PEZI|nr:hypothetical protein EJ06DRAFT_525068 [Trichodelitschia bisporula]